jgi:hypothetical protein
MSRRAMLAINFDKLIREIIERNDLATVKDLEKIHHRLEKIEKSLQKSASGRPPIRRSAAGDGASASDIVLDLIRGNKKGSNFKKIRSQTGFNDNKIRNILFRLHKLGRIKRKDRGTYTISE